jgi:cytochrome P450
MLAEATSTIEEQLADPEFFVDPFRTYATLRQEQPVYWCDRWQTWMITRYDDVIDALRDHHHFSNQGRQSMLLARLPANRQTGLKHLQSHYRQGGMSNQDPPDHTRLRDLVNLALTPRMVDDLEPGIQRTVDTLLDELQTGEPFDFMDRFANQLPAIVIAELLGLPPEDRAKFQHWSNEITSFLGTGLADEAKAFRGQRAMRNLRSYLAGQLRERSRSPSSDLLSRFAGSNAEGDTPTENEMIGSCVTLLMGGHETTRNLLGNGLLALLRHPEQEEALRTNPALMSAAVEEFLRFDAPVQRIWRVAKKDLSAGGHLLREGDSVFLMVGAANRDCSQFANPDECILRRAPNRHLTFGHGIHFCLGAALARLEAQIAFTSLLQRFERYELIQEPEYLPNVAFRGLASLPVKFFATTEKGGTPMRQTVMH